MKTWNEAKRQIKELNTYRALKSIFGPYEGSQDDYDMAMRIADKLDLIGMPPPNVIGVTMDDAIYFEWPLSCFFDYAAPTPAVSYEPVKESEIENYFLLPANRESLHNIQIGYLECSLLIGTRKKKDLA
jgi:hypothetical protein